MFATETARETETATDHLASHMNTHMGAKKLFQKTNLQFSIFSVIILLTVSSNFPHLATAFPFLWTVEQVRFGLLATFAAVPRFPAARLQWIFAVNLSESPMVRVQRPTKISLKFTIEVTFKLRIINLTCRSVERVALVKENSFQRILIDMKKI